MFASKELQELRAKLVPRFNELREKSHGDDGWTDEDRQNWEKINKDYDHLTEQIEVAKRTESVSQVEPDEPELVGLEKDQRRDEIGVDQRTGKVTDETRALALRGWFKRQHTGHDASDQEQAAARAIGVNLNDNTYPITLRSVAPKNLDECRAQTTGTDSAGGYADPQGFVDRVELALLSFSAVRQAGAEVLRTDAGNKLEWPTINDTGNTGSLEGENDQLAETDVTFGELELDAYIISSDIVRTSVTMLEDNAINFSQVLGGLLGERVARKEAALQTTGTGSSQHNGIVTASALGVTAAGATAITDTELVDLVHSVDPAYRQTGSCGFMMHDNIALYIRKLKDGNSVFIWEPGLKAGTPDVLLGHPVYVNQNMQSSVATATKTVLFGHFPSYKIREVRQGRFRRLVERYAEYDQEAFVFVRRSDSDLLNAGTNPVKHLLQA